MTTPTRTRYIQITLWDIHLIFVTIAILTWLIVLEEYIGIPMPLRPVLGIVSVLFIPGYCLTITLFPRRNDLDFVTRVAISFGVSAALMPMFLVVLSFLPIVFERFSLPPWGGIYHTPIVIILTLWNISIASLGLLRRRQVAYNGHETHPPPLQTAFGWFFKLSTRAIILSLVGVALFSILAYMTFNILVFPPETAMTEFSILSEEGTLKNYPREMTTEDELVVHIRVVNNEHQELTYRVEIWVIDTRQPDHEAQITQTTWFTLQPGEEEQGVMRWRMPWMGLDQKVAFRLYKKGQEDPYRRLHLFVNVVESTS